jgi:hypothetical protein
MSLLLSHLREGSASTSRISLVAESQIAGLGYSRAQPRDSTTTFVLEYDGLVNEPASMLQNDLDINQGGLPVE